MKIIDYIGLPRSSLPSFAKKYNKYIIFKHVFALMRSIYTVFIILLVLTTSAQGQQTAEDWFNKGDTLTSQGKYDEAIQAYDQAIQLKPNYDTAWYNKGVALKAWAAPMNLMPLLPRPRRCLISSSDPVYPCSVHQLDAP